MPDFEYVTCPACGRQFMAHEEFFHIKDAFCHCPYCGKEFPVGAAAERAGSESRTPTRPRDER